MSRPAGTLQPGLFLRLEETLQACACERDSVHLLVRNRLGPDLESFPVEYSLAPESVAKSGPPADWTRPNQLRATRSLPGRLPPIRGRL